MTVSLDKLNTPESLIQKYRKEAKLRKNAEPSFFSNISDNIKNIFMSFQNIYYAGNDEMNDKTVTNQKDEKDSKIEDKAISKGIVYGIKKGIISFIFSSAVMGLAAVLFKNSGKLLARKSLLPLSSYDIFDSDIKAPIIEEIIFRGLIYNVSKIIWNTVTKDSTSDIISSIFSSAIFGLCHSSKIFMLRPLMIGFDSYFTYLQAYKKYGLYSSIISHMTNNFLCDLGNFLSKK